MLFHISILTAAFIGLATGLFIREVPALRNRPGLTPVLELAASEEKLLFASSLEGRPGFMRQQVSGRTVWVYAPPTLEEASRQAVFVLHGSFDTPEGIAEASRFHEVAARASPGFLVVYPEMAEPGSASWGFDAPWEDAFFRGVVDLLVQNFYVDRNEVYVAGHSAGGTMSLFLQNNMPEVFKASAAVESGVGHLNLWNNASSGQPTLVVWNHNDPVLAQFGGEELFQQTVTHLRRHHEPAAWPHQILPLPSGFGGVVEAERRIWKAYSMKNQPRLSVVSWKSETPTHKWVNNHNVADAPLDASILVWDFFRDIGASH